MDKKYTWATEEIYPSSEQWNKEFNSLSEQLDFSEYKGKLGNADDFYNCMKAQEKLGRVMDKLSVYAMMKHDEDTRNAEYDALTSKITALGAKFGENTAFVLPELTALDESVLISYIQNPKLKEYDYFIKEILKEKAHVLSENEERLLSMSAETMSSFRDIFTKIDNADLPLKTITHKGQKIPLSHGTYSVILHGEDRALRKKAFNEYYNAYISLINVISSTYYGNVKKGVFYAKAKKYDSALDRALMGEDVPRSVYDNLITTVSDALRTTLPIFPVNRSFIFPFISLTLSADRAPFGSYRG